MGKLEICENFPLAADTLNFIDVRVDFNLAISHFSSNEIN